MNAPRKYDEEDSGDRRLFDEAEDTASLHADYGLTMNSVWPNSTNWPFCTTSFDDRALDGGAHAVEDFHHFDQSDGGILGDLLADFDERWRARFRGNVKCSEQWCCDRQHTFGNRHRLGGLGRRSAELRERALPRRAPELGATASRRRTAPRSQSESGRLC